jgi:hypothetical protein
MPQKANITSVQALELFRSNLINYVSKARPTLDEVSADVMRTRVWLQDEHRTDWEIQLRKRHKVLEEAQATLFSSRMGNLRQESAAELMAVHRAKRAVEEADNKLRMIKKWNRDFDSQVQPLVKQMEKLHTILANDLTKAVAYLTQTLNTLAAYQDVKPAPEATVPPPPPPADSSVAS